MSAIAVANRWIFETLSADATLSGLVPGGINAGIVPEGTAYPAISFAPQSTKDMNALAIRVLTTCMMQVKAVDKTASILGLTAIQKQVDFLLQGRLNIPVGDGSGIVLGAIRTMETLLDDPFLGVEFRQLIAVYEVIVQEH